MTGFTLDALMVTMLISTVIPILVGLVTKLNASSALKATLMAGLSIVNGLVANSVDDNGSAFISKQAVVLAFFSFVTAGATYARLLKPAGISPAVNNATSGFGVGGAGAG